MERVMGIIGNIFTHVLALGLIGLLMWKEPSILVSVMDFNLALIKKVTGLSPSYGKSIESAARFLHTESMLLMGEAAVMLYAVLYILRALIIAPFRRKSAPGS